MFLIFSVLLVLFFLGPTLQEAANTKFSCKSRVTGYYADVDSGCQIYHMCDGLGRQFTYSCPNTTLFQQRMLICDHWYMVNCSGSENDYSANLLIGQKKPFVEDSEKHPYHRTPRPDLLSQPTAAEFNIIYRTGKAQNHTDLNIVGVNSDYDQNNGSVKVTDKPAYHLPSHWSTEYSKEDITTPTVTVEQQVTQRKKGVTLHPVNTLQFTQSKYRGTPTFSHRPKETVQNNENVRLSAVTIPLELEQTDVQRNGEVVSTPPTKRLTPIPRAINFNSNDLDNLLKPNSFPKKEVVVNFKSIYKATTPVFPTKEELITTEAPLGDILNPPGSNNHEEEIVNFKSFFKATTPVFPTKEELVTTESPLDDILNAPGSDNREQKIVNFKSFFKATTPVFPTKEELITTESPLDDILNAPGSDNRGQKIVNFKSFFKATTPVFPTKEELVTTESPLDDILNPPDSDNREQGIPHDVQFVPTPLPPPNVEPPSNLFQPPKLDSYYSSEDSEREENKYNAKTESISKGIKNRSKIPTRQSSEKLLKNLRKMFAIPDYEFVLDIDSRPGYGESVDSFQVNPFFVDVTQRQHAS